MSVFVIKNYLYTNLDGKCMIFDMFYLGSVLCWTMNYWNMISKNVFNEIQNVYEGF